MMKSTMQDVELSVVDILEHGANSFPDSAVWTLRAGETEQTTFAAIGTRSRQLGAVLCDLGCGVGEPVGTLAWNTKEHLEAYFAVPSIGSVLHTMNPRFTPEQLAWSLMDAGTQVVIVDENLLALCALCLDYDTPIHTVVWYRNDGDSAGTDEALDLLRSKVDVVEYESALDSAGFSRDPWRKVGERSAAVLCYTSGTTGRPKGVVYSHRSIWLHSLMNTSGVQFGLSRRDVVLPAVPMFHVMAWNLPYSAFMAGSGLILTNRYNQAQPLLEAISALSPTFAAGVPTIWTDMSAKFDAEEVGTFKIDSLRRISSGGAAVSEGLIRWWQGEHGVTVLHGCGMTETSSTMTTGLSPEVPASGSISPHQRTQGQFVLGVRSRIVDEDGGVLAKDGTSAGELQLAGPWVTSGYLNQEGAATIDGWLPTGDIATITPDGYVSYTDRIKDVIKSGGEWISSTALETHLSSHDLVREAAVIAVSDPKWQERPAAVIVPNGGPLDPEMLRTYVADAFPRFWVPDRWIFVDEIPRTSVGKYDKRALRATYAPGHSD